MSDYGTMQARIADEASRSDLSEQIKTAIQSAIDTYAPSRLWFNTVRNLTFNTVAGQRAYGSSALSDIPTMVKIDAMFQTQNSTLMELCRISEEEMEMLHTPTTADGRPTDYCYIGDEIHLWPTPDQIYATRMIGISRLPVLSADSDTNAWMTYGEILIRSAASRILYSVFIRDDNRAAVWLASEIDAFDRVTSETEKRMPTGYIKATEF